MCGRGTLTPEHYLPGPYLVLHETEGRRTALYLGPGEAWLVKWGSNKTGRSDKEILKVLYKGLQDLDAVLRRDIT